MRTLARAAAFLILFASLGAPRVAVPAQPFAINAILPLTGSLAFLGQEEAQTLAFLERSLNRSGGIRGQDVHFAVQDDQSSPKVAVQLMSILIAQHVPVVLGSGLSANCRAMLPLIKDGPVVYCFSPGVQPERGSYMFSSATSARDVVTVGIRYFRERGARRFGAVWTTDGTGQDSEHLFMEVLAQPENKNVELVANEHFNPTDLSVAAQIAHVAHSNAEVCFCWAAGTPFTTLLRTYTEQGLTIPIYTSAGNVTYAQMAQYSALDAGAVHFAAFRFFESSNRGALGKTIDAFRRAMRDAGVRPDDAQANAWDPGLIVVGAFRSLGTNATATQIRDEIMATRGFAGIDGIYDFEKSPQRGLSDDAAVMARWDPKKADWVVESRPGGWVK